MVFFTNLKAKKKDYEMTRLAFLKLFLNLRFRQANLTTAEVFYHVLPQHFFLGLGLFNSPSAHIFAIDPTASSSVADGR